jgi:plasmid stabilization system protein ParE
MAEITWTEEAQRWLEDIFEYIAADNPDAAARQLGSLSGRRAKSVPFEMGEHRRIAVRIVGDRGIDSLRVLEMTE